MHRRSTCGGTEPNWSADKWTFTGAAFVDGEPIGIQDMAAEHFRAVRSVESGSWLGRAHQGRGLGREMREAMLHLAFEGLGAEEALSGAFEDNAASLATSRAIGYEENGEARGTAARRVGPHHPLPARPRGLGVPAARRRRDRRARGCLDMFVGPPVGAVGHGSRCRSSARLRIRR